MRILILDDDPDRHKGFAEKHPDDEIVHCTHFNQALDALRTAGPFDWAFLDHDLDLCQPRPDEYSGGGMYGGGKIAFDGHDFAFHLKKNPALCPPRILIHSWNPDGAKNMEAVLKHLPLKELVVRPFGQWD